MKRKFLIFASGTVADLLEGRKQFSALDLGLQQFILQNCLVLAKAKQFEKVDVIYNNNKIHFDIGFVTVEVTL